MSKERAYDKSVLVSEKLSSLYALYGKCRLCARRCGVNRRRGEKGFCRSGSLPVVYSYFSHKGEEPPISGERGSGTVFFSHCVMGCVYCQNNRFSQSAAGEECDAEKLAGIMMELQRKGCHNINLVSPTHYMPVIIEAVGKACGQGLSIPIVYNTGGYDSPEAISLLKGIIDIYLPDMKYADDGMSLKYSNADGYVKNNRDIVADMFRQTGALRVKAGLAVKGLIIRLLILPGGISGMVDTLEFIRKRLGTGVSLSIMSQYYPAYKACEYAELSSCIAESDYFPVIGKLKELGLEKGWVQPFRGDFDESFVGENF